jgi:hypothetical protein
MLQPAAVVSSPLIGRPQAPSEFPVSEQTSLADGSGHRKLPPITTAYRRS